jgi:hypothetical protein
MAADKSQSKSDILQGTLDLTENPGLLWDRCTGGPERRTSGYAGGHGAGDPLTLVASTLLLTAGSIAACLLPRASCDTR